MQYSDIDHLNTPVLFLVFNRPETTEKVFETIRKAKPLKLFVAADGPRDNKADDQEKCKSVRSIVTNVDWNCEVKTLFNQSNLGCQKAVSKAITWFFEHVDEGIILEDDCLPSHSFFKFCEILLEKYRHNDRIFVISGDNFQKGNRRTEYSYYFSIFNHIWGWAAYKRAWQHFDFEMSNWPLIKNGGWLYDILHDKKAVRYWENIFQNTYEGKINSWGYRWTFACWSQNGLTILPNINLVQNIGFGSAATHTFGNIDNLSIPAQDICFPLSHPPFMIRDFQADMVTNNTHFRPTSIANRIKGKVKHFFSAIKFC